MTHYSGHGFDPEDLVSLLKEKRAEFGITSWMAMADKMGVSYSSLADWRYGHRRPAKGSIKDMAKLFDVPVDEMMDMCGRSASEPHANSRFVTDRLDTHDAHFMAYLRLCMLAGRLVKASRHMRTRAAGYLTHKGSGYRLVGSKIKIGGKE